MNWLFFALLAPAIYAVVVFFDKYILERQIKDYRGMPIYSAIIAPLFGTIFWFIADFPLLGLHDAIIILLTGMLTIWGLASYFKALSNDEASKIQILFQITPIITLLMAYFFLKEEITSIQLVGFAMILGASLGVSMYNQPQKFRISSTFFLILLTDFIWALSFVLFKYVSDTNSFSRLISYESWGLGLGGLVLYLLFPEIRIAFHKNNKKIKKKALGFVFVNEGIFVLSRLCTYMAISLGPVALVDVVAGSQVFFAIVYGWGLTLIAPKIFKEDVSKKGLLSKVFFAALVFIGLWLVQ